MTADDDDGRALTFSLSKNLLLPEVCSKKCEMHNKKKELCVVVVGGERNGNEEMNYG